MSEAHTSAIEALAIELQQLRAMQASEGWKVMLTEMDEYLSGQMESLKVCKAEDLPRVQGKIAAIEWIKNHPAKVAEQLEGMEQALKQETAE